MEIQKYNNISFSFETNSKLVYMLLQKNNYPGYLITNSNKNTLKIKKKMPNFTLKNIKFIKTLYFLHNIQNLSSVQLQYEMT